MRGYPDRDQADDFAEELQRSGILTTVIGPDVLDEGWGVAVPATEALRAGLIAAGLPRY